MLLVKKKTEVGPFEQPVSFCPPQIPHGLCFSEIQVSHIPFTFNYICPTSHFTG